MKNPSRVFDTSFDRHAARRPLSGKGRLWWRIGSALGCASLLPSAFGCLGGGGSGKLGNSDGGTCETGNEGCVCYANQTCNASFECKFGICVKSGGTGGGTNAGGTSGGDASSGGTNAGGTNGGDASANGLATSGSSADGSSTGSATSAGPTGATGSASTGSEMTTTGSPTTTTGSASTNTGSGTTGSATTTTGSGRGTTGSSMTTTGSGGTTTGGAIMTDLPISSMGWIDRSTNSFEIQGGFWTFGDSLGANGLPPGDCQNAGYSSLLCSTITMTLPAAGSVCASGTAAEVPVKGTSFDYTAVWGAGLGVDLNASGGDAGTRSPYDAVAHGVKGFSFSIDFIPATGIRVEFPAVGQETAARYITITSAGTVNARFSAAFLGYDLSDTAPVNASELLSIEWLVPSSPDGDVPYGFCISNLRVLTN